MVDLAQLVNESLVRHGVEASFDPGRVQWSKWFRIEDTRSVLLAPSKPGLFALAEEIAPAAMAAGTGKRMLALFEVAEADDLGMALGRLFLPRAPHRERLEGGKCFARYAVIEDGTQRESALAAFQTWLSGSAEAASGVAGVVPNPFIPEASPAPGSSNNKARNGPPEAFSSGF